MNRCTRSHLCLILQKKYLLLLLCDLLLSVNINFDLLRNKLERTPVNLTHLNPRDVGLYTWFICLKLSNGIDVGVFIAFSFLIVSIFIFSHLRILRFECT